MSFLVVQRTHEIGVRMALGAQRHDVLRLVILHALKLVCAGTIIGLIVALLSTSTLRSALYQVSALDFPTFTFVTLALAAVAFVASYVPARRATRADPMMRSATDKDHGNARARIRYGIRMLLSIRRQPRSPWSPSRSVSALTLPSSVWSKPFCCGLCRMRVRNNCCGSRSRINDKVRKAARFRSPISWIGARKIKSSRSQPTEGAFQFHRRRNTRTDSRRSRDLRFFSTLGVNAEVGRTFLPNEDKPGADRVVVLSHNCGSSVWRGSEGDRSIARSR